MAFTIAFSVIVYFYLQPLINNLFEDHPDEQGSFSARQMVTDD